MSRVAAAGVAVQELLTPEASRDQLRRDVRAGLTASPKRLSPKWLYDEEGSRLFGAITELPEYYLTRAERSILDEHAAAIVERAGADTLVELGAGTSEKTRLLLDAMEAAGSLAGIVVLDVDDATLQASARRLAAEYPQADVRAVVGDIELHAGALPRTGRRLVAFLGSSIGNFRPLERARLLRTLARTLRPGESFLVGVDLVKNPARLVAAYDDAAGVTARFTLNLLHRLNRDLGATFDPGAFEHVARWDERNEWMDMRLRSLRRQRVRIGALGLDVPFEAGEELHTEISAKFRRSRFEAELRMAGLEPAGWWEDAAGDFALALGLA